MRKVVVVVAILIIAAAFYLSTSGSSAPAGSSSPAAVVAESPAPSLTESKSPSAEPSSATGPGSLKGVARFSGTLPVLAPKAVPADKQGDCKCQTVENEDLIVDATNRGIKDVIVRVLDVKADPLPAAAKVPEIDQKGCKFAPHITIVQPGSDLLVLNPDKIMHNVHTTPLDFSNEPLNKAMVDDKMTIKAAKHFEQPEIIQLQCDVHGWMKGYIVVHDPRFVMVTGPDGKFEIKNIPPGKYKVSLFQGDLGEKTLDVEIKPGSATDLGEVKFEKR